MPFGTESTDQVVHGKPEASGVVCGSNQTVPTYRCMHGVYEILVIDATDAWWLWIKDMTIVEYAP